MNIHRCATTPSTPISSPRNSPTQCHGVTTPLLLSTMSSLKSPIKEQSPPTTPPQQQLQQHQSSVSSKPIPASELLALNMSAGSPTIDEGVFALSAPSSPKV